MGQLYFFIIGIFLLSNAVFASVGWSVPQAEYICKSNDKSNPYQLRIRVSSPGWVNIVFQGEAGVTIHALDDAKSDVGFWTFSNDSYIVIFFCRRKTCGAGSKQGR